MAWGILMAGMTVFGMVGLLIAAVRMEDEPSPRDQGADTQVTPQPTYRKAA